MGRIISSSMGNSNGMARKPAPAPKPISVAPKLTGIAKARSVGGNAYAKGQANKPIMKASMNMGDSGTFGSRAMMDKIGASQQRRKPISVNTKVRAQLTGKLQKKLPMKGY